MRPRCPTCGLAFERESGFHLGAIAINISLVSVLFVVYLVAGFVLTSPDPPIVPLTIGGLLIAGVLPIVLYPFSKTVWLAISLAWAPLDIAEEADAVTWLAAEDDARK